MAHTRKTVADFPEVAAQWHPTKNGDRKPTDEVANSIAKVWWKCPNGPDHEWLAAIRQRERLAHLHRVGDVDHAGVFGVGQPDRGDDRLDSLAVGFERDRHARRRGVSTGQGIDRCGRLVDRGDCAAVGHLGHPQPAGVPVSLVGQPANEDPSHPDSVLVGGRVVVVLAADHVGVHARTADVFAHLLYHQHVYSFKR